MTMHRTEQKNGDICRYSPFAALMLDNGLRRLLQNPERIVGTYVKEGMTVVDIGCGPGMFSIPMAAMVGDTGRVIAVDIQQEMLDLVRRKSFRKGVTQRIIFHRSEPGCLNVSVKADFILSFYMVHEVPDQGTFLREVYDILKPGGRYLIVEPSWHVSESAFEETVGMAVSAGFKLTGRPKIRQGRAAEFASGEPGQGQVIGKNVFY